MTAAAPGLIRTVRVDVREGGHGYETHITCHGSTVGATAELDGEVAAVVMPCAVAMERGGAFLSLARASAPDALLVAHGPPCPAADISFMRAVGLSRYEPDGEPVRLARSIASDLGHRLLLERVARHLVGRESLRDAQERLRSTMFREAYHRTGGNKEATARLLGVTRAAVQKIARNLEEDRRVVAPEALVEPEVPAQPPVPSPAGRGYQSIVTSSD